MMIANSLHKRRNSWFYGLGFAVLSVLFSSAAHAMSLAQAPLFLVTYAEPLVMLNMSNDHQLYFKAYDDYSNLDSSSEAETTYKHSIDYYGYFDSDKCYSYSSGIFEPTSETADKYCSGINWSGNFLNWATMSRMDAVRKILYGGMRSTDTASVTVLERAFIPTDSHSFVKYYDGGDVDQLTPYSTAISMCNTTYASSGNSRDNTDPPLMRVAQGNYSLWTAHEVNQCHWSEENNNSNSNNPAVTGISASSTPPSNSATGSAEFTVRVKVCVSGLEEDNCEEYPSGYKKPTGLLHEYGEDGSIKFGLMTGSYQKNKSGGVLRKNITSFADEVRSADGIFLFPTDSIVGTLNKLRITRFDFGSNQYNTLDSCSFGKYGFDDGECSNWGNPQSELFYESLRYFAGKSATPDFNANDSSYINAITTASWSDPLNSANYCAPANIIQFNASTNSFDGDQLSGFSDFSATQTLDEFTDEVGDGEGVTDAGTYFIGTIPGSTDKSCTAKDLDNLSDGTGTCPEAPWLEGTYQIAGLAYFAKTESIRSNLLEYNGTTADIRVNTFGVALSPAQPVIRVPVPGTDDKEVLILPACMEFRDGSVSGAPVNANGRRHNGNCAIVDFKIVEPHTEVGGVATGKFLVLWESAQYGGDYDQDMGGIIEYQIDSNSIEVTTDVYGASTGGIHGFGYVISGTTQDGLHIHSGHNDFKDYEDPYSGIQDCISLGGCNYGDAATSVTYAIGTTTATQLETPLYYAAKWGGFSEEDNVALRPSGTSSPNNKPDQNYEWDNNSDGIPDNYFYSTNPSELYTALSKVFEDISEQTASASSTAANSQKLATGTNIFQATFNSEDWSGGLLKYDVNTSSGALTLSSTWGADGDAATELSSSGRTIITYNPDATGATDDGMAFTWARLNLDDADHDPITSYIDYLNTDPDTGTTDALGQDRLNYLRGDDSKEKSESGGIFRIRSRILGDIVNSGPVYVGDPNFRYSDTLEGGSVETYSAFKSRVSGRTKMVYVGANDGMLHGFNVADGEEELAYIPSTFFTDAVLTKLTSSDYTHRYYVDGSPTVGDAVFSDNQWHTVLVGGLNAGGKGIYALDITNPSSFSETDGGASSTILWEITSADTVNFGDLGYTFSRPAIVRNYDGTWVAVFGNGYDNGHAVLYIVNVQTGALIDSVTVDGASTDNGLSTPAPVDINGDGTVDAIYAGDLKGNMWKFIPDSGGSWKSAFGANPLFSAPGSTTSTNDRSITTRPEVGLHPDGLPGVMVYFGTGKYVETTDNVTDDVQRFYGIWDLWNNGSTSSLSGAPSTPSISDSNLLRQCVTTGTLDETCVSNQLSSSGEVFGSGNEVRYVSSNTITTWNWSSSTGHMGWYIDLPETGERQVTRSLLRAGRIIFVTTIPSDHPCSDGGSSWLMELDAAYGGSLGIPVFDLNGDGVFDENDMKSEDGTNFSSSGVRSDSVTQSPTVLTDPEGEKEIKYRSSSSASSTIEINTEKPALANKRRSWVRLK